MYPRPSLNEAGYVVWTVNGCAHARYFGPSWIGAQEIAAGDIPSSWSLLWSVSQGRKRRNIAPSDREDGEADEASADSGLDTANVSRGGPRAFSPDLQVVGFGGGRWQTHSDLGEEAAIRDDFLAGGGWHSLKTGTTGTTVGRPRRGVQGKRLRDDIERDLYPIDVLREVRGKQDRRSRAIRDHLAIWLYARGRVRRQALADLIGYDRKTIDRLHRKGQRMLELLEQINGKLDDVIERLRATNPTSEEITETIEELIADVLGEAA